MLAASTDFTPRPITVPIEENANAKAISSRMPPSAGATPFWNRNPTAYPAATMMSSVRVLRADSATSRPTSTADRAIGSDRNRSISPLCRSSARPTEVPAVANAMVCTKIAGIM
ncbi:hypothetical protein GCM10029978_102960 [Actinoallomurus acanthiterrae]